MAIQLVVTAPFADYAIGDRISDPEKVQAFLQTHHPMVTKISVPDEPEKTDQPQA